MFNLQSQVQKQQQLKHDKVHGLPNKPKHYDSKVNLISDIPYNIQAEQEGKVITRSFYNRSADFGKRLSKRKGQYHRPGGGYAGHTIKGG